MLLAVPLIAMAAIVALNSGFYRFLARTRGPAFAAWAILPHLVYYACCGASVVIALGIWHLAPRVRAAGEGSPNLRLDLGADPAEASAPAPHHDRAVRQPRGSRR